MSQLNQAPERRFNFEKAEVRAAEDGKPEVFGYALKWGVPYDMGWFTEEIARGALASADLSDVRVLFNHDPNHILGRTKAGTAKVGIDDTGMWYRASLPESPNGENVRVALERGDVDQSSWAFYLDTDSWEKRNGRDHRTITKVASVVDASPVTYPANPDTTAAKRSLDLATDGDSSVLSPTPPAPVIDGIEETFDKLDRTLRLRLRTNKQTHTL